MRSIKLWESKRVKVKAEADLGNLTMGVIHSTIKYTSCRLLTVWICLIPGLQLRVTTLTQVAEQGPSWLPVGVRKQDQ